MAELNFGLLTPPGSQSIGNAFVQGMDQAAVARAQENQNALAQYTLGKARREDELTNQMLAGMQGADTIEKQADVLRRGGKYKEANELITSGLDRQIKQETLAAAQSKLYDDKINQSRGMLEGVTTPEQYIAWHEANHNDPILGKALALRGVTVEQSRARINAALEQPGGLERLINESKLGVAKFAEMNKPSNVQQSMGSSVRTLAIPGMGGNATVVPGSVGTVTAAPSTDASMLSASIRFNPETGTFQNVAPAGMSMRLPAAAGAVPQGFPVGGGAPPIAAPAAVGGNAMIPSAPPSVNAMRPGAAPTAAPAVTSGYSPRMLRELALKGMQPDGKGGQTFIPGGEKDPVVEQRVATGRAVGAQIGKNDAIAIEKLPTAIATGTELIRKLDALLGDANVVDGKVTFNKQAPAKGFENAFGLTGMAARVYPGSAAADFQAKVKELLGGAFLEAYEILRGAQGITDVEGKKATEARTRMGFDLSPAEFIIAAREYRKTAAEALGRSETRLKSLKGSNAATANRLPLADIMSGNQ